MRTIILGDSRMQFQADISTALMLDSYPFEIIQAKNFEEISVQADQHPDAIIVISDSMLTQYDPDRLQPQRVYGYVSNPSQVPTFQALGIKCIGLLKTSRSLLGTLSQDPLPVMQTFSQPKVPQAPSKTPAAAIQQAAAPVPQQIPPTQPTQSQQPVPQTDPASFPGMHISPEMMIMFQAFAQQMAANSGALEKAGPVQVPVQVPPPEPTPQTQSIPQPEPVSEDESAEHSGGKQLRHRREKDVKEKTDAAIEEDLLADAITKAHKTKVITVYAAKGGVGKTSIATELATCLALTSNGRRNFRVCIVDYNIDFGDVATTLALDEQGPNMTYWASEIREMLASGKNLEDIHFERKQIETYYLQKVKATGLYTLAAPIMHEDSMFIKSEELDVMLTCLIENGGFDYIICDTGNNTRDSSVIAIDKSDFVLLIATQDVTTANCNVSVLRTLRDTGFDTEKVRLIINNVMSPRETGISVQEVEETFPYECICRIKATRDIIRANNLGQPLVYKPNHDYTKQIQRIVRYVTGGEAPKDTKRGLFGLLMKK